MLSNRVAEGLSRRLHFLEQLSLLGRRDARISLRNSRTCSAITRSASAFSVSERGALVYVPGGAGGQEWKPRELVWVNRRDGTETPSNMPSHNYGLPRLSPDGARVAVNIIDAARGNFDHGIGVWDFARERLTQLSMLDIAVPVWTADGQRIVFASELRNGPSANLFFQSADGTVPSSG